MSDGQGRRVRAAAAKLTLLQAAAAVFGLNPHQRRGPDGKWIKMADSELKRPRRSRKKARRLPAGFDPAPLAALGWEPDDPQLVDIAEQAQKYGFTGFYPETSGGAASFDARNPDALGVGPKRLWTPSGFAEQKARYDGQFYMSNAGDDPAVYHVAHEAGHRAHHFATGAQNTDRQAAALAQFAADKGMVRVDPYGHHPPRPFTVSDFDMYGDPEAFRALRAHGLSAYGAMNIQEAIAELHAAYQLGSDDELVAAMARSEGWSR